MSFPIDTIPFIVSIALELLAPLFARRIERIIENRLNSANANREVMAVIKDYISFSTDSLQVISSIILSLVTIILLPYFRENLEYGLTIALALGLVLSLAIYYFGKGRIHEHQLFGLGPYGMVSLLSISLNIFIILLIMYPFFVVYYLIYVSCLFLPYYFIGYRAK